MVALRLLALCLQLPAALLLPEAAQALLVPGVLAVQQRGYVWPTLRLVAAAERAFPRARAAAARLDHPTELAVLGAQSLVLPPTSSAVEVVGALWA